MDGNRGLGALGDPVLDLLGVHLVEGILAAGVVPAEILEVFAALRAVLGIGQNHPEGGFVLAADALKANDQHG